MRQVFIKELSAYTKETLADKLRISVERAAECIEVLTTHGVLRLRSANDSSEYDIEPVNEIAGKYQFVYVGLTIFEDLVLVVYPKYMNAERFEGGVTGAALGSLQHIFSVLRKSSGSYSDIATLNEGSRRFNDRVALMLMLLEMYADYGVYSNYVRTLQTNGNGEISWERTIANHRPYISNDAPIYLEYETVANSRDDSDFVTRLHRCALTECSAYMNDSGLSEILGLEDIELSDERVADIGDADYLCNRLDNERAVQFVTWKQEVIDLLKRYVSEDESVVRSDEVICLGSTSFYNVWEKACKVAFGDLLDKRLSRTGIKLVGDWRARKNETLLGIVPSPEWSWFDGSYERDCNNVATLIPDTVTAWGEGDGGTFAILDAKYYTPKMGKAPKGMPGVESVTKQILYQRAYREFISDHGYGRVVNAFLIPYDGDEFRLAGRVKFPGVFDNVEEPFSDHVDMLALPAERIWKCYLDGRALGRAELVELFNEGD